MSALSDSALQFLAALTRVGVSREVIDRVLHPGVRSSAAVGTVLLRAGAATPAQIQAAQALWASECQPAPQPGPRLGPYAIERKLGAGAGGEVYLVRDPRTGARYAAKRLIDLGDAEDRLRFRKEAEVLASLRHPHIAKVHAADLSGPTPYFVLDYYAGGTLQDRLRGGPLDAASARALIEKLAAALEAVHARGILHRDLKPENVLFDEAGEPRLADFGLGLDLTGHANRLTQTGVILGTPSYMPPEQALDAKRTDVRSDVYGLGAILYACLTARPPHPPQATLFGTLDAVINDPVRPPREVCAVDPGLEAVCLRALSKDPRDRYPSARAILDALGAEARAPASPRRLGLVVAALAVVVGGVGVAALVRGASPEPGQPAPPTHSGSDSKPPLEGPAAPAPVDVGAVKRALAEGELQRAWELLMAAPEDAAAIALGLEAIERAAASDPRPEVDAEGADVWAALVELAVRGQELERSALEKVSLSSTESVDWGPQGQRVREAIEAALLVKARPGTVDALLLATADRYLRVHRAVNLFAELEDPAPAVDAERFPQAHVAFAYLSRFLSLDEPGLTPERHRAQKQACLELERRLDAGVLDWPPLLAGSVLGATPNLAPLRKDWVEAWLARLRPVPPKNQLAALALELAAQCLAEGDGLTAPDVGLPTRLVAVADDYNQGLFLPRRQLLQAALLPLTLGDLEAAKARIDQVPTDTRLANLRKATHVFATYEVLCARALPLEARGPLLEKARGYLEGDPSRERWALLRHIELLGSPSAAAPDVAAWERRAPVAPSIVTPAWYTHYDPRSMRFPCEPARPGDTRAVLWLPPVGR